MAVMRTLCAALVAGSSLVGLTAAHPGEKFSAEQFAREIEARDLATAHAKEVTAKCGSNPKYKLMMERAAARRSLTAQILREQRGIVDKSPVARRDQVAVESWMNQCHDMSASKHLDLTSAESAIFTSNATTALVPETIVGPYFVEGELIRRNVTEGQKGVPIHLDIQFIDINTCEVVPNMLVDIWHSNATGVYSGVSAAGQGGLNSTYCRGVQQTDKAGVVQFDSVFPGHYMGRTPHIHVLTRRGGTILPNNTYSGGTVNHIGQLYFDQELISSVETFYPYTSNTQPLTTNRGDFLTADEATTAYDPFVDYVKLSSDANDGLLMWISIGINGTADYNSSAGAAAHHYADGGVASPGGGGFPGGGFPFPGGSMPPGFPTSGMPPFPMPTSGQSGFPTSFPSGFPTAFPGGPPGGGFPGFPMPTPTGTAKPWGPCNNRKKQD